MYKVAEFVCVDVRVLCRIAWCMHCMHLECNRVHNVGVRRMLRNIRVPTRPLSLMKMVAAAGMLEKRLMASHHLLTSAAWLDSMIPAHFTWYELAAHKCASSFRYYKSGGERNVMHIHELTPNFAVILYPLTIWHVCTCTQDSDILMPSCRGEVSCWNLADYGHWFQLGTSSFQFPKLRFGVWNEKISCSMVGNCQCSLQHFTFIICTCTNEIKWTSKILTAIVMLFYSTSFSRQWNVTHWIRTP